MVNFFTVLIIVEESMYALNGARLEKICASPDGHQLAPRNAGSRTLDLYDRAEFSAIYGCRVSH